MTIHFIEKLKTIKRTEGNIQRWTSFTNSWMEVAIVKKLYEFIISGAPVKIVKRIPMLSLPPYHPKYIVRTRIHTTSSNVNKNAVSKNIKCYFLVPL